MSVKTSLIYAAVGLILILSAATMLSASGDTLFSVTVVGQSDTVDDFDVQYSELPQSAQGIVDSAISGESIYFSRFDEFEPILSFHGSKDIKKGETVYSLRTVAEKGGPFGGILRFNLLSAGGLLLALSYISQREETTLYNLSLLPAVAATVLISVKIYQGPAISVVPIAGYLAFGLALPC